jgi:hypothetical protein
VFWLCLGLGLVQPARLLAAGKGTEPQFWFQRSLVGIEVGPTGAQFGNSDTNDTRYCARFDGAEVVRRCVAAGSEYLVIWARDGDYAYYNTRLLLKCPGLGERDVLREAIAEARPQKLPVIAYCVVQQGGHYLAAHPEFEMRDPAGRRLGRFCYNSGYLEVMKQIVAEQLAYGINGFHLDMMDQGFGPPYGCWCAACRKQFEAQFGGPMPPGVTWDENWDRMLEFRYRSSERFEKALYAHIKSLDPGASVDFNYHGNPPFSWEVGQRPVQHAGNSDFVTGETGMWGFSAATVGLNAEFYRAATPNLPFQIAISRDARCYHNQTVRPLPDLRWELFALLAHGGFVTVVDKMGFDGWLDPVCYERLGAAFKEAQAKRLHFGGRPVQDVGLYFSSRTRDWVGRENPAEYFHSFQGAHKAMLYEHLPWGIVLDENATLETLRQFAVVLLPNVGIVSEKEVGLFARYVEAGGNLIVTGLGGCYDSRGKLQDNTALERLTGARFVRKLHSLDNWVQFSSSQTTGLARHFAPATGAVGPFLVKGPAGVFEPTTATPAGQLLKPYRTTRQIEGKEGTSWPMSPEAPVGPALLLNTPGKGRVLTFACSPDYATASEHHIPEARRLLVCAVRLLHPSPRVEIAAPVNVEAVVTDDPSRRTLRVHLLAYHSPPQTTPLERRPYVLPALLEDAPIYRATIRTAQPIKRATAFNQSTCITRQGGRIQVVAEAIHEVIALRY